MSACTTSTTSVRFRIQVEELEQSVLLDARSAGFRGISSRSREWIADRGHTAQNAATIAGIVHYAATGENGLQSSGLGLNAIHLRLRSCILPRPLRRRHRIRAAGGRTGS